MRVCVTIIITEVMDLRGGGEDTGEAEGERKGSRRCEYSTKKFSKDIKHKII